MTGLGVLTLLLLSERLPLLLAVRGDEGEEDERLSGPTCRLEKTFRWVDLCR